MEHFTEPFTAKVNKFGLTKLYLITIKDNAQASRWVLIGKVNDWIKRYSNTYLIVRGMEGGIHFHLLAYIPERPTFRPAKGIHFHITTLGDDRAPMTMEDIENIDKAQHFSAVRQLEQVKKLNIPIQCLIMASGIRTYFTKLKNRSKRLAVKTRKQREIQRVIDYLSKNHNENPEDIRDNYTTFIVKY